MDDFEPPEIDPDMEEEYLAEEDEYIPDDIEQGIEVNEEPVSPPFSKRTTADIFAAIAPRNTQKISNEELLQDLISIRENSLAKFPSMNSLAVESSLGLVTQHDGLVRRCNTTGLLFDRPVVGNAKGLTVTLNKKTRFYLKPRNICTDIDGLSTFEHGTLLKIPIDTLLKESHTKQIEDTLLLDSARGISSSLIFGDDDEEITKDTTINGEKPESLGVLELGGCSSSSSLWVEKYAPKSFPQLLSSEKTNREVLKSLKAWDSYVFAHKDKPTSVPGATRDESSTGVSSSSAKKTPRENDSDVESDGEMEAETDESGNKYTDSRPYYKVILLCGPPGSGKTTLAHVIAKHCGYNVIEVNASDDRSSSVLKDRILRSTQSNTISLVPLTSKGTTTTTTELESKANPKRDTLPNCIVLDEIDGIDNRDAVDMLCNMIKAPLYQNKLKKGGSVSGTSPLTRPLICVCNDQYAPQLRELRKYCKIFNFSSASEIRLTQRLRNIMMLEGVDLPTSVLTSLCAANGNDIRSCLNTLQFATLHCMEEAKKQIQQEGVYTEDGVRNSLASQRTRQLVSCSVKEMICHGLKDEQRSAHQIWRMIYSIRDAAIAASSFGIPEDYDKEKVKDGRSNDGNATKRGKNTNSVSSAINCIVEEYGDMDLLIGGIHENLLNIPYTDPCMVKTEAAFDWLSYADVVGGNHLSNTKSVIFAPAACVAIHLLCSIDHRAKIMWPKKDRECHFAKQEINSILQTLVDSRNNMKIQTSIYPSKQTIMEDVISFLVTIIHPRIRQQVTSSVALTPLDKKIIEDTSKVMASCGLSFITNTVSNYNKTNNSKQVGHGNSDNILLQLEPNVYQLISKFCVQPTFDSFNSKKCNNINNNTPSTSLLMEEIRKVPWMSGDIRNLLHLDIRKCVLQANALDKDEEDISTPQKQTTKEPSVHTPSHMPIPTTTAVRVAQAQPSSAQKKVPFGGKVDAFFMKKRNVRDEEMENINKKRDNNVSDNSAECKRQKSASEKSVNIYFKFVKGSSMAVRRTVTMNEFL